MERHCSRFSETDSIHFASTFYYFISTMARTKQTARKHTGKVTVIGSARKVKTKLKRALLGSDPRWGTAKEMFVKPKTGGLRPHPWHPNRLDYRCMYIL